MIFHSSNAKSYPLEPAEGEEREGLSFYDLVLGHLKKTVPIDCKNLLWQQFQSLCYHYCRVQLTFEEVVDTLIILFENKATSSFHLHLMNEVGTNIEAVEVELIEYI